MNPNLINPKTGKLISIMGCVITTGEVYDCNLAMITATVRSHFRISEDEAIVKLATATIDSPITIGNEEFWAE